MTTPEREFELAVRSFSRDLYRFAHWLTRDRDVAEDLVQEAFYRAWRYWQHFDDERALKKWLLTIVHREHLRRFGRKQLDTVDLDTIEVPPCEHVGLDDVYAVHQSLQLAPASLREPLLLQVLGGFSAEEMAGVLETTPGAITTRLSRARLWLRERLRGSSLPTENVRSLRS